MLLVLLQTDQWIGTPLGVLVHVWALLLVSDSLIVLINKQATRWTPHGRGLWRSTSSSATQTTTVADEVNESTTGGMRHSSRALQRGAKTLLANGLSFAGVCGSVCSHDVTSLLQRQTSLGSSKA
eukprot:6458248-Amphidinium_carterae.1